MGSERIAVADRRRASPMSSSPGPTSSTRWTRTCSPRSATPSARSAATRRCARSCCQRPGQAFHRRARPRICLAPVPAERRSRPRRRGAAAPHRMAAGRVQRGRGGAAAGDRRDPWRLHRRRRRPRQRLRPARRQRRRLLPGRRGRRRDHRRSRHAAAARLSDPAGRAARARPIPAGGWARRRRRATASSTGSRPTARRRSPPGCELAADDRRQIAARRRRRQEAASTTAAAARSRRGCATSPCGTPRPWSAPTSTEAVQARLGKTEPKFGPLAD